MPMPWFISDANLELAAVYGYDAFNRRVMSIIVDPDLSDTAFHTYDGWRQVVQYTLDDTNSSYKAAPTKEFVWGSRLDELLSYRRRVGSAGSYSWENYFVLHGGQDTAAKLVSTSGTVVEQYEYDPYGRVSVYNGSGTAIGNSAYGLPFLWKSIRLDNETGLLYMRNRYYSVELGRFLTDDPIGVWGDIANAGNPLTYAGNRPLVVGDPLGLQGQIPPTPCYVCHGPNPTGLGPRADGGPSEGGNASLVLTGTGAGLLAIGGRLVPYSWVYGGGGIATGMGNTSFIEGCVHVFVPVAERGPHVTWAWMGSTTTQACQWGRLWSGVAGTGGGALLARVYRVR